MAFRKSSLQSASLGGSKLLTFSTEQVGEVLVSIAFFSTFIPFKIYPAVFAVASLYFIFSRPILQKMSWSLWLWGFIGYVFFWTGLLLMASPISPLATRPLIGTEEITNLVKLVINSLLLVTFINWLLCSPKRTSTHALDVMLHFVFFLTLLQLLVYIQHAGVGSVHLGTAESSAAAASFYDPGVCFWFTPNKNIFGARVALYGFIYVLNYFIIRGSFPIWRSFIVLLSAWLSNSRTPMVALFVGIVYLLFRQLRWKGRILLGVAVASILPFFVLSLLRFDSLLSTSDGFGIRVIYWSTFFSHFSDLSIWGLGFASARHFLSQNAPVYLGEPHLHNLFLNNYLDFGIPGSIFYIVFLIAFYQFGKRNSAVWFRWYWTAAFLPIISIATILSTPYDSDIAVYLASIFYIAYSAPATRPIPFRVKSVPSLERGVHRQFPLVQNPNTESITG